MEMSNVHRERVVTEGEGVEGEQGGWWLNLGVGGGGYTSTKRTSSAGGKAAISKSVRQFGRRLASTSPAAVD